MLNRALSSNGLGRATGMSLSALLIAAGCASDKKNNEPTAPTAQTPTDAGATRVSQSVLDAGSQEPVVVAEVRSICSQDAWCWQGLTAQSNHLRAVSAVSEDNFWAVGDNSTLLHFNGTSWNAHPPAEPANFLGVWASETNVWVVGEGAALLHFDGASWIKEEGLPVSNETQLRAVYSNGAGGVWVVGAEGALLELGEAGWSLVTLETTESLNAIWGRDAEIWVAGDAGTLLHLVDGQWQVLDSGTDRDLFAVHGNQEKVWFAGASGEIRSYDTEGESWVTMGGDGPRPSGAIRALRISENNQAYAAGNAGDIYHWDGELLCPVEGDAGAPEQPCPDWVAGRNAGQSLPLYGLWIDGDRALAVGEYGIAVQWENAVRTVITRGAEDNYLAVSGAGIDDIWVAGDGLLHRSGGSWSSVTRDSERAVYAVQALPGGNTFVAGTGGMARRLNDEAWQSLDVPTDAWLRGLASDGRSGWLVGSRGRAWGLLNGNLWTELETPTNADLLGVWSLQGGATWAVGEAGTILRHDGVLWAAVPSGPDGGLDVELRSVWSSSDDNAWAVGTAGTLLHYDGVRWTQQGDISSLSLNSVWGRSASDVWAVGSAGTILHFDGTQWASDNSGVGHALNGVWGSDTELFIVGERETLLVKLSN